MMQVLSMYPLTDAYARRLERLAGQPLIQRCASEFRHPTLLGTFKALASLRKMPLLLASEDPSAEAMTNLLITLAGVFGRGPLRLFDHQLTEYRPSRWWVLRGLWRIAVDTLVGHGLNRRHLSELARLQGVWGPLAWAGGRRAAYLKSNLWFGVKAGGSVGHVAGVINGLSFAGQTLEVFANELQPLVHPCVAFHPISVPSLCAYPSELNLVRYQQVFTQELRGAFRKTPFDWIYQRVSLANYSGALLSRELGIPLVAEYNGSEVWVAKNWGRGLRNEAFAQLAEDAMLKQASLVVAVSEVLGEELQRRGIPEERVFVHPNCVDLDTFRPDLLTPDEIHSLRGELGIAPDALVITFLGTFGAWHGIEFLARAWRNLHAQEANWMEDRKLHLLLVGDGPLRKEAETILHGIPRTTFAGLVPQAQAPRYLAASDVFLSPHMHSQADVRFFGSPTKLFEYMAMGRPILASGLEQIQDILTPAVSAESDHDATVDAGALAVVFSPGNEMGFLKGLHHLVDRPDLRQQLGRNALTRVREAYTWHHFANQLLTRLEKLRG